MSTKIYNAFKIKRKSQLWAVLRDIQTQALANVKQRIWDTYWNEMIRINPEGEEYQEVIRKKEHLFDKDWAVRLEVVRERYSKGVKENATAHERSNFDIDVSLVVHQHESGYYLRAFCDQVSCLGGALNFLYKHPQLVDFHYQNQTDRPENITARQWNQRRKVWDDIFGKSGLDPFQLTLQISNWQKWYQLDPWLHMAFKFREKPPRIPLYERVLAKDLLRSFAGGYPKKRPLTKATARKGLVKFHSKLLGPITLKKGRTLWSVYVGEKKKKTYKSLEAAVSWVRFEHLPSREKAMIQRMIRDAKLRQKKTKPVLPRKHAPRNKG